MSISSHLLSNTHTRTALIEEDQVRTSQPKLEETLTTESWDSTFKLQKMVATAHVYTVEQLSLEWRFTDVLGVNSENEKHSSNIMKLFQGTVGEETAFSVVLLLPFSEGLIFVKLPLQTIARVNPGWPGLSCLATTR